MFAPHGPDEDPRPGRFVRGPPSTAIVPSRLVLPQQVSLLISLDLPTIPSSTTNCHFPVLAFSRYLSRTGCRVYPPGRPNQVGGNAVARSGVRLWHAGSPAGLAATNPALRGRSVPGSSSYGLVIHLQLLPTPPRGDAVTFGYRFVTPTWWGLTPHRSSALKGAHARRLSAGASRCSPNDTRRTLARQKNRKKRGPNQYQLFNTLESGYAIQ